MKNKIINSASVIIGRLFASSYKYGMLTYPLTNRLLQTYIGLRRRLPVTVRTHVGNHYGSNKAPFRATQGWKPLRGLPSGV